MLDTPFLMYLGLVCIAAVAFALAFRMLYNCVTRSAQNEVYRAFYERNVHEYYRKLSSFFRRKRETHQAATAKHVLDSQDYSAMRASRHRSSRFPFEAETPARIQTTAIQNRDSVDLARSPLEEIRFYKTTRYQNAPRKEKQASSQ